MLNNLSTWLERPGAPLGNINALIETADGRLLQATGGGLRVLPLEPEPARQTLRTYAYDAGLSDPSLLSLAEDRDGNLWLASENGGVMKVAAAGFTSWNTTSELGNYRSIALFTDQRGRFYWHSGYGTRQFIHRFADNEFSATELVLPRGISYRGWGWQQWILQTRNGEWSTERR